MRVGLFTSPHLERYNERIEIDGEPVDDADFALALEAALRGGPRDAARPTRSARPPASRSSSCSPPPRCGSSASETSRSPCSRSVSAGVGTPRASTSPSVAVITGVGLDHTAILGDTLEAIAAEKAAIIRPASAPVLGPGTDGLDSIFLDAADAVSTHARAVREDLDFSPVSEHLTVRYRIVERPSSSRWAHARLGRRRSRALPGARASGTGVPGRQHRDRSRSGRSGARSCAAR